MFFLIYFEINLPNKIWNSPRTPTAISPHSPNITMDSYSPPSPSFSISPTGINIIKYNFPGSPDNILDPVLPPLHLNLLYRSIPEWNFMTQIVTSVRKSIWNLHVVFVHYRANLLFISLFRFYSLLITCWVQLGWNLP